MIKLHKQKGWETFGAENVGKKLFNDYERTLIIAANLGTAAAGKDAKLIAATAPDVKYCE